MKNEGDHIHLTQKVINSAVTLKYVSCDECAEKIKLCATNQAIDVAKARVIFTISDVHGSHQSIIVLDAPASMQYATSDQKHEHLKKRDIKNIAVVQQRKCKLCVKHITGGADSSKLDTVIGDTSLVFIRNGVIYKRHRNVRANERGTIDVFQTFLNRQESVSE